MNILIKHIIRNMKENIGRTILIMLSLFVVSILVAIISLFVIFMGMIIDASSHLVRFSYSIQSSTGEKILNEVVDEMKNDFDIIGIAEQESGYLKDEEGKYISNPLQGLDINQAIKFKLINLDKEKNVELKDNEAIINSKIAKKFNLKEGQEFDYYGRNGKKNTLIVKYIVNSMQNLEPAGIATNEKTYLKIKEIDNISYIFLLAELKDKNNAINQNIENFEIKYGIKFDKNTESPWDEIKEVIYPAVIVLILVFTVIFVSLNSIVKIIINERIPTIGTFRSIGATKKQIIGILILELLIYTVIPSLVGAISGVAATKLISKMAESILNSLGSAEKIDLRMYIFQISLITITATIIFQMALSIVELIKVSKLSIKDSIFSKHTSKYKYSKLKIIFGLFLFLIGIITLIMHTKLTYWYCLIGIISVFISIALIVPAICKKLIEIIEKINNPVIRMSTNTLKNNSLQINTNIIFIITISISLIVYSVFNYMYFVEKSKQNFINSDIYVEEKGVQLYDKIDEFYKLENVKDVSSLYELTLNRMMYDSIRIANHTAKEIHLIYSNDYEKLLKDSNSLNVDVNMCTNLNKYEIIVSEYYRKLYNFKEGDSIVLEWEKNVDEITINTPISLKICGFTDLSKIYNNSIIISSDLGEELKNFAFKGYSNVKYFITLEDNTDAKEIRKRIINELGILSNGMTGNVFTKEGYINNTKQASENYMIFMTIIVAVIVALALVGIINNQTVSFMERRKELATLYSIAMSKKQLKNMILIENVLAFINSTIASVLFYIIISKIVEYILQILLIPIYLKFTISGILVLLLIVTIIILIIQKNMREHIKHMNIVEEIKYE